MMIYATCLSSYIAYTYNIYHNTEMPSSVTLNAAYPRVYMRVHTRPYIHTLYMYLDTNYKFAASQVASSKHFSLHGEYMFIYILTQRVFKGHLT